MPALRFAIGEELMVFKLEIARFTKPIVLVWKRLSPFASSRMFGWKGLGKPDRDKKDLAESKTFRQ